MRAVVIATMLTAALGAAYAAERFPPPEFTDHALPAPATPAARAAWLDYADAAALAVALGLASWLAIKRRSRAGIVALMAASLLYFGFWRSGCVCPVGATQNVALAAFDAAYALPWTAAVFFFLPLLFALLFGRVFCAAVCPLGAAQDAVLVRPAAVPAWLQQGLGLLPYVYLGSAVLLAGLGGDFIICRYDPFVSFFRLSGSFEMLLLGAGVLGLSAFVGRPYCRFACPYSVLLRWASRLSAWHFRIAPDECIPCRLCEDSCPFGAIAKPTPSDAESRAAGKRRLARLLALLPLLMIAGGALGWAASGRIARSNAVVRQADLVLLEEQQPSAVPADEVTAFRKTARPAAELYAEAARARDRYAVGGALLGALLGLAAGGRLIRLSVRRTRTDYEADRAECVSCGRCLRFCPRERARLGKASAT